MQDGHRSLKHNAPAEYRLYLIPPMGIVSSYKCIHFLEGVILVVLTEKEFRFSLLISQLLAKAIPVRGAKFLFSAILANLFQILIQQASMGTHPGAFLVFSPPCREMRALSLLRIACPTSPLTTRQLSA